MKKTAKEHQQSSGEMSSNVAVYMYVGSCVMCVIQTPTVCFVFSVRELFSMSNALENSFSLWPCIPPLQ